jgi:glycosyltransferase involved in cell wall biosynthesis
LNKFDDVSSPNKVVSEIINTEYFFYPAQFWAHKNHIFILKALKILKDEHNKIVKIVFVGSDRGNKDYIIKSCNELDLDKNQVIILDFVSNNNLYHLYKNSKGLIMPTYFGPTNIPPLEALYLNVPIVYPLDLAVNEDFSDLIIKIDLNEVNSLVKAILLLQNNNSFRTNMLKNFNERKKNIFNFDNKKKIIEKILLFKNKRDTWE